VISSRDGAAFDVLAVMSKFMAVAMPMVELIRSATQNPARALRQPELGSLVPGRTGDATILHQVDGRFNHVDGLCCTNHQGFPA
jgi:dihydroorotase